MSVYKGRIPRAILLVGATLGLSAIIGAYFHRGPLSIENFGSYGKFFVALVTYIVLFVVAIRANFKCGQVSCPAFFSVIFLLGYYSYPPLLRYWGLALVCVAIYIIIRTLVYFKKSKS